MNTHELNSILADTASHLNRYILEESRSTLIWDALIQKGRIPPPKVGDEELKHEINGDIGNEYVRFKKTIREYPLEVATIKSPYICLSDLTTPESTIFALNPVQKILTMSVKWVQHRRLETCFEKTSGGIITCDGTHKIQRFAHGDDVTTIDPSTITHGLHGEDIQAVWDRISRITEREGDYGRHDGEPQHALVMGSKSFPSTDKEPPFMDSKLFPLRYSHIIRRVGQMIHIVNPLAPRYTEVEGKLVRVEPFTQDGNYNYAYDTAEFEVAYALHKSAMEYQVESDDPQNYLFDVKWMNQLHEELNPVGDTGFFLLTMAGAMCPRQVDAAITLIFRRA
jgi:hypothetical protein